MPIAPVDRVFFPFVPDWGSPFRVRYEFRSSIFTNESGGEQRRALRTTPRISLNFKIQLVGEELRRWNRLIDTAQNLPVMVPDFSRSVHTVAVPVGAVVRVDSVASWLVAGREIALSSPNMEPRAALVQSVTGNQIALAAAPGAWPVDTRINPVLTGELQPDIQGARVTNSIGEIPIEFECDPGSEIIPEGAATLTYAGSEVFYWNPNWSSPVEVNHIWPVEKVDFGRGLTATYRDIDFPTAVRASTYLLNKDAAFEMLQMFLRAKGQRGEFLYCGKETDIEIMSDLVAGTNTLLISGRDFYDSYRNDPVRKIIQVKYGSTELFRTISDIALIGGNSRVTVDQVWPNNVARDSLSHIAWTLNSRFATDTLELEWLTDQLAQTKISIRSLPMIAPNDYTALRSTLVGDDRETLAGDDRQVVYL